MSPKHTSSQGFAPFGLPGGSDDQWACKFRRMLAGLAAYDRLGVAFSGGVDSSVLLIAAHRVLGDKVVAFTARSPIHPPADFAAACSVAAAAGIDLVQIQTDEWQQEAFLTNTADRCYECKKILFARMAAVAADYGIAALVHGANADDAADYRPGLRAAAEMGVGAPLADAGLGKADIRQLARSLGLSVWDRPAMACLATRIPYGQPITLDALNLVAAAEDVLAHNGFAACRVRIADRSAHIEVPLDQMERLVATRLRAAVVQKLRSLGLLRICLDLEGYVPGKMNRWLEGAGHRETGLDNRQP